LENTHELKGKMKEKIEANKELGMLSKELAKIILDVPVTFEAEFLFFLGEFHRYKMNLMLEHYLQEE